MMSLTHRGQIFEKSKFANEVGAAIAIAPNATRILTRLGFDPKRSKGVYYKNVRLFGIFTGDIYDTV